MTQLVELFAQGFGLVIGAAWYNFVAAALSFDTAAWWILVVSAVAVTSSAGARAAWMCAPWRCGCPTRRAQD
jgi:hypothetical protein